MNDTQANRLRMVDNQLRTNGVTDPRILAAMAEIPRELFIPASKRSTAYIDEDICVREQVNGTAPRYLLKPHIFAKLLQLAEIKATDLVLVVGCTTGYSAAVVSRLAESVVGLESDEAFVQEATETVSELGIDNVAFLANKLVEGMKSEGPYDVIILEGSVEVLPTDLLDQLKEGGRLVVVQGQGLSGQAYLYRNSGTATSGVPRFNASIPLLPGTELKREFVF